MQIKRITRPAVALAAIGTLASTVEAQTYDDAMSKYDKDVDAYNKAKDQYDQKLAQYNQAQDKYQKDLQQFENDKKAYDDAIAKHQKALSDYEADKDTAAKKKQEYDAKLAQYRKLKSEWDAKNTAYNDNKKQYDTAMATYKQALSDYRQKLQERIDTIARNKQQDEVENRKRKEAYDAALKQQEIDAKKPGRFSSDVKNALSFASEPNAKAHIDIGTGGAVALIKAVDGDWRFNWDKHLRNLSSDKLDDATLKENDLSTRVLKKWDPTITTDEFTGGQEKAPTYVVLAKKNTPFKVTYTNIQNSTYDGKKLSKIEYIYEVLETGSDSDLMQLNIAKDPTISVWLRGETASTNHRTRVKLTPIFYDQNGNKIIPTKEKPIFLGMGSMNARYATLDKRNGWFIDGKDLFSELMGFPYDRDAYVKSKFYEKYKVKWEDRNKNGFFDTVKSEWDGPNGLEKQYWNSWDEVTKPFNGKRDQYMKAKYGNDVSKWPSQYREIVYKLHNGTFVKLNDSRVTNHPDGYYSDTNVDAVYGWDDPASQTQYIGAGVIHVTTDNFSMEFGSTTPRAQRFALNTIVADIYIAAKPKLELQKTPEPPMPVEPTRPNVVNPVDPGTPPPTPPKFEERPIEKPVYDGPKKPEPPVEPKLVKPTPPEPVKPPEGAVPNDAPKVEIPEFNGGVVPLDPPKVEIPEFNGGVVPLDPPIVEKPRITPPDPVDNVVVKKVKTSYVDEKGKPLLPTDEGEQPKKDIPGYDYVTTTKDKDGNTTHIYKKKVKTSYVDEKGKPLLPTDEGEQPKKDIPGYDYVKTTKDEDGNTTHIYKKKVKTSYVDEKGKPLLPTDEGEQPKKDIPGYEFVKTTKDEDGNTTHIYRKKPEPKQLPKTGDTGWLMTLMSTVPLWLSGKVRKKRK